MSYERENPLRNLRDIDPPTDLMPRILRRIHDDGRRRARLRFALSTATATVSLALLVPSLQFAFGEFMASGFLSYLSLLFSDGATVLASWSGFALALLSALPVVGLIVALSSILALSASVVVAARQLPRAFPGRLTHS